MEKINKLKRSFKKLNIDGYLIPKNDEFFVEYISKHNDRLNYISNFSGSYGFALILRDKNFLFVDGRYTLQAINQSGESFKIITLSNKMPFEVLGRRDLIIGFDPRLSTKKTLKLFFKKSKCKFKPLYHNLIDKIWKRKILKNKKKFFSLPGHAISNSYVFKINKIVLNLKKRKADYQFITASENNAWLLNIRGEDTRYTPIPYSHILIDKYKNIKFFCDLNKISFSLKKKFRKIEFLSFKLIEKNLLKIQDKIFLVDANTCSFNFEELILKNNKILDTSDPIYALKAIKGKKEINNIKKAHIYDGVALTKYLFWLKKNIFKKKITEISASRKLYEFRKKNDKFKFLSFPTISGSGPNGAIIHYQASKKTNRKLKKGDIYLVDSGGQYEFGTTDVTRTISLENSDKKIKDIFTRVLKGHIAVSKFNLNKSSRGSNIDKVARKYLRQINLDYAHGTGHGVGYYLNVHEGPHAISKGNKVIFKEGMIVSNEPGYYEKNRFGIRIENLIYVKRKKKKLFFENLTMVPIDKSLIDFSIISNKEKDWINNYHKSVFKNIHQFMNPSEKKDLKSACSAI